MLLFIFLSIDLLQRWLQSDVFLPKSAQKMVTENAVSFVKYNSNIGVVHKWWCFSPRCVCWPAWFLLLWSPCSCPIWTSPPCCTSRPPAGSFRRLSGPASSTPGGLGGCRGSGRGWQERPGTVNTANSNSYTRWNYPDRYISRLITGSLKISLFQGRQKYNFFFNRTVYL